MPSFAKNGYISISLNAELTAFRAYAFYDIFNFFHFVPLWEGYERDVIVFKTVGTSAMGTGEVNVIEVMITVAAADAILLMTTAVVDFMQQIVLNKKSQGTEYAGAIHVGHPSFHVIEAERFALLSCLLPHKDADGGRLYAVFLEMLFRCFHHFWFFSIFRYSS